ncbi:family 43 glycosylhydrolase [Pedobacter frigiditerrae]|uniref:family 43 glycosylhydrolase n=1 Tax=Pedobacter frigiditerrae TaxID=2530452 RepID=UPI00292CA6AA|nr:family 43 glycosylhydrolase [Pedobacter frigiditerrae]
MNFFKKIRLAFVIGSIPFGVLLAQNNPVIENVPDVGVINHNGKYYLAGVNTNGGFYISNDLVNWKGPVHVFSMDNEWTKNKPFGDNQIHAADIVYLNGKFHFYWSVNFWGGKNTTVHVGYAVADKILGPYTEPDKKNWFDSRIDPDLFVDTDSSLYLYTVKFTDGNTIWGQRLSSPAKHQGAAELLFNSTPLTWERMDNSVTEGPEVIKYRSKYYMMYNANHVGSAYGNYALGVAEADHPLGFNSGNKYPKPVVQSNLNDAGLRHVFAHSLANFSNWKYTVTEPGKNWMFSEFPEATWGTGDKGFGSQAVKGSSLLNPQTVWNSNDIWVRKRFEMPWLPSEHLQLLVNHAGPVEVFLDGKLIYKGVAANYLTVELKPETIETLKSGNHLLAVHGTKGNRGANLDVDLIDPQTKPGDDIMYNPGQPNLLKGPNGFEWWLVYFAIKNGGKKGQFINRVLFNDHQLTVDGPTSNHTPGYHPNPSLPVFGDGFEENASQFESRWLVKSGKWQIKNEELQQENSAGKSITLIKSHATTNYFFKAAVKCNTGKTGHVGIVAYYANEQNFLEVGLDKEKGSWYYRLVEAGKEKVLTYPLAPTFDFGFYHSISVYKNDKVVAILIDELPAPINDKINTDFAVAGLPGLFTQASQASFDGVIYTPGWDEYSTNITGWENGSVSENGLRFDQGKGAFNVFKGDLLPQYEFSTQIYLENTVAKLGSAGIYPVYVDQNNFLKAAIDLKSSKLLLTGKLNGKEIINLPLSLKRKVARYPDPQYSDHSLKVYTLKKNTELTALELIKAINTKRDFNTRLSDSLKIQYSYNDQWKELKFDRAGNGKVAIERITFPKITADAIRITSSGNNPRLAIYKLNTDEEITSDYNLRAVKLKDKVILFLDGEQVAQIKVAWPAARVGLTGENTSVSYNGIMLYEQE